MTLEVQLHHEGPVRIVVCGSTGSGKTSFIATAATESFPDHAPPVLPPTLLPASDLPDRVGVLLVDTSSRIEDRGALQAEVARAESIILTYAVDSPQSVLALRDEWLPELRRFGVRVPIIVVGCKLDRLDSAENPSGSALPEEHLESLLEFRDVERCLVCSSRTLVQVLEVVYYAQKAVLHPVAPLYDTVSQCFQPACRRALRRVFRLCDLDFDGHLSDAELNRFQVRCFGAPLSADELEGVKRVVSERLGESGVSEKGLALDGFLYLHELFIDYGRMETTWTGAGGGAAGSSQGHLGGSLACTTAGS